MSNFNARFERLAKKFGFRIRKVPFHSTYLSVQYRGHHIMTVPKKMVGIQSPNYRDESGHVNPHYFDREHKLKNWNFIVKRTPHIENYEKEYPWRPFRKPL